MTLREYIEATIIPLYREFDKAHREDHARTVIDRSLALADKYGLDRDMMYAAAAYHDTGLRAGRKVHHLESGSIVREDARLREWFSEEQIETIAQAAEDHRASADNAPRGIYGRILAEADRMIEPVTIIRRTVQYGLSHYPDLDREGHWQRTLGHLTEKYGDGGYLKLWLEDSPNAGPLEELRAIIRDEDRSRLRDIFDRAYQRQRTLDFLDANGIQYEIIEHPPLFTIEEAMEWWKDIDDCCHCKNLFMRNHKGNRHYLISFACRKTFDIHGLEHVLHQGKLSFASPDRMMRCLGLKPGSVSPFGLINDIDLSSADPKELFENGHRVKFYYDSDLTSAERVSFHPCDNTASVIISSKDFMRFLDLWGGESECITIE